MKELYYKILKKTLLIILNFLVIGLNPVLAEDYIPSVSHVEAALLYRFAQNFSLSSSKNSTDQLTFCVVGDESISEILSEILSSGTISGKKTKIIRLKVSSEVEKSCSLVFISSSTNEDIKAIIKNLEKNQVFSVSDIKDFAERGGVIEYVRKGEQVKYIVNLESAKKNGIEISSQLVGFAEKVL